MPKITRKQQKVFAASASNNGVFGSLQANDPAYSQDPDVIQSRTAYANGWNDATYSAEKLPPLEEFQSLQYLFSRQIAYIMQEGIPEWNTNDTYYKGALVKSIQQDGSFILYASIVDNNQGNLVTDTTKWQITNTSTNFHQGIPNWRADVIYSEGDWVKTKVGSNWAIYESIQNNNLNNAVSDRSYWTIKPFSKTVLFTPTWFDYVVQDESWLRADDFTWHDGTVYTNGYNHLVADIANISPQTETIGSYTVTYYQATDGHKIVLANQETTVANIYNESGVAWYYIIDTTNTRFKLPRENPAREVLGKSTPVVFADGVKSFNNSDVSGADIKLNVYSPGGSFAASSVLAGSTTISNDYIVSSSTNNPDIGTVFKADLSETTGVYKGKQYLYFYVGQFSQSATEQSAGITTSQLNQKVDVSDLVECKVVVESYSNGDNWYRVWSDGWVEQGGYTSSASATINLLKQFADTNYQVMATVLTTNSGASYYATKVSGKTTSQFVLTGNSIGSMWEAKGMST